MMNCNRRLLSRRFLSCSAQFSGGFGPPPELPQRRVVVTGLGLVTPLATGVESTWEQLIASKCGVRKLVVDDLKLNNEDTSVKHKIFEQLPSQVVAPVCVGDNFGSFPLSKWSTQNRLAPFVAFALCAAEEALKDAKWKPKTDLEQQRTGVAIGGGIGCTQDLLDAARLVIEQKVRRLSPFFIPRILINMAAGHVSIRHGLKGPNHAAVTACASGAHSVGDAARMIRHGDADVMVAGGTESCIDALSIAGFSRAKALSTQYNDKPEQASRPFDQGRDGFIIGEGAGILVLEELNHAVERGAHIYAEIRGYGMSGDANHITQPAEDGGGATLAMIRALERAGLQPSDIGYINAHATSTPLGDAVEARAICSVFGDHATTGNLSFSSTKGATGHLLGAAGAVEAIFSVLALKHGIVPPTLNLENPDPIFSGNFSPADKTKKMKLRAVMTNSFGFGGTNASLVFAEPP